MLSITKGSILFRIKLILGVLSVFFILNMVLVILSDRLSENKLQKVYHTQQVIIHSEKLLSSLIDAETGQRGYLLTMNPDYLSIYKEGLESFEITFNKLLKLTTDSQESQIILRAIYGLKNKKFEELKETINLADKKTEESHKQAVDIVNTDFGKNIMDLIRGEVQIFINGENEKLKKAVSTSDRYQFYAYIMFLFLAVFYFFLSLFVVFIVKNKLISPLKKISDMTEMVKKGEKQNHTDKLSTDEIGHIFSQFYQMSDAVHKKTQALLDEKNRDDLTGIWNRVKLAENLSELIDNVDENNKLAILFIDVNDFKSINDTLGHDIGDKVLIEVARRLKSSIRSNDSVYRLGGDEFVVIIKNVRINTGIDIVVNNLLDKFKQPMCTNGHNVMSSLSIGIAIAPDNSSNAEELLRQSDIAMYKAKKDNSINYAFFENAISNNNKITDTIIDGAN